MQNNNNSSNNNNTLNRQRSNGKGKFLTRSHAMRESTSPPRTPTPRSGNLAPSAAINDQQQQSSSTIKNENSNRNLSTSPVTVNSQLQPTPPPPTQSSTNLFATNGNISVTQLDLEFPKLTPPKSKSPRNNNNSNTNNNNSTAINSSNPSPNTIAGNRNSEMNKSPPSAGISSSCNGPVSPATSTGAAAPLTPPAVSNPRIADSVPTNDLDRSRSVSPLPASSAAAVAANTSLSTELLSKTVSLDVPKITTSSANAMCTIKVSVATDQQRSSHEHLNTPDSKDKSIDEPNEMVNRKNRNNPNVKGAKTSRTKHGACSLDLPGNHLSNDYTALDGGGSSSGEHFTDQNGVDLLQFFKITLNKNTKDRSMLLRIEKELASLAQDESRDVIRFPTMSSYNRMLIHRVAAWFGMEHNVDGALQCVIVGTTKTTRIPEIRFKSLLSDTFTDEPLSRKSILKRDAHSFEEYRQGLLGCPDRSMLDRKAKSFEEREQEYERAKRRIFKDMEHDSIEQFWHNWSNSNSGAPDQYNKFGCSNGAQKAQNNRLLKVQSSSMDTRYDGRPGQTGKSHSFGGYGPQSQGRLARGDSVNSTKSAGPAVYAKQESSHSQQTWRISPSSSGYKTQSQSIRSESITPSPSYGSVSGEHTPEPAHPVTASGVVWAVTDMASVPKGSVLIDPQTLQPIVNQDGSIYHFDPTNLPQCNKLQIMAASPTSTTPTAPSPTFASNEAAQNRKKYKPKPNTVRESDDDDGGVPNANCDNDGTSCGVVRNSSNPEIEISSLPCNDSDNAGSISDAPVPITMNTLLAPIDQIHAEICSNSGADNDSDDTSSERCPSSTSFLNVNATTTIVRNQSTSPNMPDANIEAASDDAAQYVKPNVQPEGIAECENVDRSPPMDAKTNNYDNEASEMRPPNKNDKLTTESPPISTEYGKKDEIKMMPAVLPVLGYTAAPAPSVYPAIDSGIQMYPGTQPAPTAYPTTTYQQGLDGSVYAVSQPMIYGYPAPMENEYPSIFLPMYDQSLQPSNAQGALMPATAPPTPSSSTMYPTTGATTMAVLPYGASPNIYPGQVIYTSDQYNPTNSTVTPPQQYINVPIGYTTYPYNGSPAYPAYWGQAAMTYYVPQPMSSTAHGATNSVLPSPSINGPNTNQLIGPPLLQHSASHNTISSNNNTTTSNINSSINNTNSHNTSSRNNTPINKNFNSSSSSSTSSNTIDNTNHIVSQQKTAPPNSQNVHGNNTPTIPVPNTYTPSPSGENKLTNYSGPSQPNVFQYPCAVTVSSTPNYGNTSITSTVAGSGSQTPNQSAMISTPGRSHFPNSPSTTTSNEASPSIAPSGKPNLYNVGPHAHVPPSPSSHINTANTKNNPPLFPTPNNILTNGIVPHINQDYHDTGNTGNNTSSYERKKNQQNSNRKTYSNGSYRPIPGANSNSTYNNQPMHPSSSSGSNPNARKPALMPQPTEPNAQQSYNVVAQHNGNRTPPAAVAYNRNNSNNSQGEHNDKRPPMNTNANRNHSHASGSGAGPSIMHGKGAPLIPTLPVSAHTSNTFEQRPRGPRPKPLDLRRSANSSTRNTPSTNSTESNNNNSPNSIVSNSIQHPAHQTPLYISRGAHPSVHHSTQNALEAAACGSLAYNPHSGMYVKLGGQAYITHSMTFPNKPHQTDVRQQQLQPLTGIYPTMNMMLTGFPQATRPLGPRPSHVNPNYKGNRAPR